MLEGFQILPANVGGGFGYAVVFANSTMIIGDTSATAGGSTAAGQFYIYE